MRSTILVVDDNATNRALAQATLEEEGHEVRLAESGDEALRSFEAEPPDCVLLDVRMPGMDGVAVCSRMRAMPGGVETPIIFLTALRDLDTFDRAQHAGADDFLTKPVRPTDLVMRVEAALKLKRMGAELREHYELVRQQRDALMRLQLQKEQLTAFVVHDLKNPLNSIDLAAQLLLRDKSLANGSRSYVRSIREGVRSLLRLTLNLLDISKGEEGMLVAQTADLDLAALAADVLEGQELKAQAVAIRLEQAVDVPRVRADPDLLRRTLENLIDNALTHAPKGSTVRLTATLREPWVELRVADEGGGVPTDARETIFHRFVQADTTYPSVARRGRGLGLAFCKLAAEAHGGSITVEDGSPGAVFCVRLPHDR